MTHVESNSLQDLTERYLDSVSGGVTVQIGPVHLRFDAGSFGVGVGNVGAWIDGNTGYVAGHIGSWGGHIG
jgi:hypothetical protein